MKKVLLLVCAVFTVMLVSCESSKETMYSKEDLEKAIAEAEDLAYKRGYERGYDEAEYYAKGEIERAKSENNFDKAYEAGYEVGYEDGYSDGLEADDDESYHGSGVIKKDRD